MRVLGNLCQQKPNNQTTDKSRTPVTAVVAPLDIGPVCFIPIFNYRHNVFIG
jgi:hypothetical protein